MHRAAVGHHKGARALAQRRNGVQSIHELRHLVAILASHSRSLYSHKTCNTHCQEKGQLRNTNKESVRSDVLFETCPRLACLVSCSSTFNLQQRTNHQFSHPAMQRLARLEK